MGDEKLSSATVSWKTLSKIIPIFIGQIALVAIALFLSPFVAIVHAAGLIALYKKKWLVYLFFPHAYLFLVATLISINGRDLSIAAIDAITLFHLCGINTIEYRTVWGCIWVWLCCMLGTGFWMSLLYKYTHGPIVQKIGITESGTTPRIGNMLPPARKVNNSNAV
jgi:hypothetical protein